jgi:hypothetical protein
MIPTIEEAVNRPENTDRTSYAPAIQAHTSTYGGMSFIGSKTPPRIPPEEAPIKFWNRSIGIASSGCLFIIENNQEARESVPKLDCRLSLGLQVIGMRCPAAIRA